MDPHVVVCLVCPRLFIPPLPLTPALQEKTPLHLAAEEGKDGTVQLLVQLKGNIEAKVILHAWPSLASIATVHTHHFLKIRIHTHTHTYTTHTYAIGGWRTLSECYRSLGRPAGQICEYSVDMVDGGLEDRVWEA